MNARSLISHDIPALSVDQTGRDAFYLLADNHVKQLPVLDGGKLVGLLSEEDIFTHRLYDPIRNYDMGLFRPLSVRAHEHLFEVMRILVENRLTVLPVVDDHQHYLGLVSSSDLLRYLANTASLLEPGAVIVLEMDGRDYSLATLARIVEEEETRVLCAFVTSSPGSEHLEVTLKLNRLEVTRILASFQRYEYEVKETFAEPANGDSLRDRYEMLMNYLEL